jgi:hypothetical protein
MSFFAFGISNVLCKVSLISVLLWSEEQMGIQMMKLSDDRIITLVKQSNLPSYSYLQLRINRPCLPSGSSTTTLLELYDVT